MVIDEYIDTGTLQLRAKIPPSGGVFIDDDLATRSNQLAKLSQAGAISMMSTAATVAFPTAATTTVVIDLDTGYTSTLPVKAYVTKSNRPLTVKIANQTGTGFDLQLFDSAGAAYTPGSGTEVEVYYSFGTPLQRLT